MEERDIIIEVPDAEREPESGMSERTYNLPVSKIRSIVQGYLKRIAEVSSEDDVESRESLYDMLEKFAGQTNQPGTSDDFHNLAVDLGQRDEYALACDVILCGMKLYPKSTDLLADFLEYGTRCGRTADCKKQYDVLMQIPRRRWTWRAFLFLVDFLKYLMEESDSEEEISRLEEEMLSVAVDFRKYHPYREDAYRIEAGVYECLNDPVEECRLLEEALEKLEVAPKCALRYADIMFQRGKYADAAKAVERAISDATQTMASINEGYVYYLSALCKIALTQREKKVLAREEAEDIYGDFNIALAELKHSEMYLKVIKTKTNTLINKTGVDVPSEYDELCACIAE